MTPPTEGHLAIADLVNKHGVVWVENTLAVSRGTVGKWLSDGNLPQPRMRKRCADVLSIPVDAWNMLGDKTAKGVTKAQEKPNGGPRLPQKLPQAEARKGEAIGDDVRKNLTHVLSKLRRALDATENHRDVPTIAQAISNVCRLLARLSGELDVTEAQILRSAAWQRLVKITRDVLSKYQGAAAALDKALAEYEGS